MSTKVEKDLLEPEATPTGERKNTKINGALECDTPDEAKSVASTLAKGNVTNLKNTRYYIRGEQERP